MKFPSDPAIGQLFKPYDDATYSYQWNGQGWDVVRSMTVTDDPVKEDGSSSGFIKKLVEDVYNETPTGEIDGTNRIFKLTYPPLLGSEHIYVNGVLQRRGLDYEIVNEYFTLGDAPFPGESVICSYGKTILREILNEVPTGEINGQNNVFVLNNIPISQSEYVYLNGVLLIKGEEFDYTIKDNIITLIEFPEDGELITCTYKTNS
jgi:hypothetical protein